MAEAVSADARSSTGLQANLAGTLCYLFGLLTGVLFFLIEKQSRFVKFHALQSMLLSAALFIMSTVLLFIPVINVLAGVVVPLGGLALWIMMMIKAYQGQYFKLPVIGDMADKSAGSAMPAAPPSA